MKKILFLYALLLSQNLIATVENNYFQYQVPLTPAIHSLQKIDLPLDVLNHINHLNYTDIAVFNQQDQRLDHQIKIESTIIKEQKKSIKQPLNFYTLNKNSQQSDQVETITSFWSRQEKKQETHHTKQTNRQDQRLQYIIELPKNNYFLNKLALKWQAFNENKMIPLKIESSNDLISWKTIKRQVVMAELRMNQQRLLQNTIYFSGLKSSYLRISEIETRGSFKLTAVIGSYDYQQKQPKIKQWRMIQSTLASENTLLFDTGGVVPITEIRFKMPAQNNYYQGQLYSRANQQDAWIYQQEIQQYHLQMDNQWINSKSLKLSPIRHRYWKIALTQPITTAQQPLIELVEQKVTLFFLAQGETPYILKFGKKQPLRISNSPILKRLLNQSKHSKAKMVYLDGDITKLKPSLEAPPVKKIVLWIILFFGTALMAKMAFNLYQEINEH